MKVTQGEPMDYDIHLGCLPSILHVIYALLKLEIDESVNYLEGVRIEIGRGPLFTSVPRYHAMKQPTALAQQMIDIMIDKGCYLAPVETAKKSVMISIGTFQTKSKVDDVGVMSETMDIGIASIFLLSTLDIASVVGHCHPTQPVSSAPNDDDVELMEVEEDDDVKTMDVEVVSTFLSGSVGSIRVAGPISAAWLCSVVLTIPVTLPPDHSPTESFQRRSGVSINRSHFTPEIGG